jgi:hypothetical protein
MAVGNPAGIIKQNTSRQLKQKISFLEKVPWENVGEGYFVTMVGIDGAIIRS